MDERFLYWFDFHDNSNDGFMAFDLYVRFPHQTYVQGGFWRNPDYVRGNTEFLLRFILMSGTYHYYELSSDTGQSYWREMQKSLDSQKGIYDGSIFDLGSFETVDAYQWHGLDKEPVRNGKGEVIIKRPPIWEVATVDLTTDARLVAARTTGHRDDVFKLTTRLNRFVSYTQGLLAPYAEQIKEMQAQKFVALSQMPKGTTDEMAHVFNEIGDAFIKDETAVFKGWTDKP